MFKRNIMMKTTIMLILSLLVSTATFAQEKKEDKKTTQTKKEKKAEEKEKKEQANASIEEKKPNNKGFDHEDIRYTYLNGINFDFTNNNKSSYVGHFNIFVPAIKMQKPVAATTSTPEIKGKRDNKYAINIGILKVNYQSTTKFDTIQTDKVLENPLDIIDGPDDSYLLQYNKYSTQTKVTSYSFYAQPMVRIGDQGAATFYLHGHLELLASQFETTRKVETIQNKKITLEADTPVPQQSEFLPYLSNETTKNVNLESGYFGAGSTIDFNFADNSILFLQGTVGYALNYADRYPSKDADGNYTIATTRGGRAFYLVRTYFQYVTSESTQLVVGTDIRGHVPKESPYFAVYAGLNIGLDKLLK